MIINHRRLKGMQVYKEKGTKDYLIVDLLSQNSTGMFEGLCTAISESPSSLCISTIQNEYLTDKCSPVSWKKIPLKWQNSFLERLEFPEVQFKESKNKESTVKKKLF